MCRNEKVKQRTFDGTLCRLFLVFSPYVRAVTGIKEVTSIGTDYKNQSGDLTGRLCKQSGLGTTGFVFCNDQKKAAESGGQYCLYSQPSGKGYSVDTCSDWEKKKKEEEQKKAIEEAIKSDSKTYYYANGIYVKNGKELGAVLDN
ncbi:hypothetical protein J2T38_002336 [Neisseria perflava]|uniref:hypothetical protein n=1 Tax=Neisseria perflava TaxID=33053 RepID=UPI00209E2D8B|nr:hypothetical protein [Neisseria perflava]MCP1773482.1 hypothetical protein [Neisseria perflava]